MTTKRTAVYLRVSTIQQDVRSQSDRVKRWLKGHNIDNPQWYIDQGASGATMKRPRFDDLQAAIFDGEHDTVVMYSLDRFARTMVDGLVELEKWRKRGLRIVFTEDQLEISCDGNPLGELFVKCMMAMKLAFAEAERQKIRSRQAAGIDSARVKHEQARKLHADGMSNDYIAAHLKLKVETVERMVKARPGKLYWGGGRPDVSKERVRRMRKAYRLRYEENLSFAQIARALGVSKSAAARYVREETTRRRGTTEGTNSEGDDAKS
jgi:DNA invertase Pin-like site-specific DNA recombinase